MRDQGRRVATPRDPELKEALPEPPHGRLRRAGAAQQHPLPWTLRRNLARGSRMRPALRSSVGGSALSKGIEHHEGEGL